MAAWQPPVARRELHAAALLDDGIVGQAAHAAGVALRQANSCAGGPPSKAEIAGTSTSSNQGIERCPTASGSAPVKPAAYAE
ncbi:MAG: hypothetical protein U1E76_13115 [Planctomycetota bacterium]